MVAQALDPDGSSSAQLFAAIRLADQLSDGLASIGTQAAFTIDIANNITLAQQLDAINLGTGSSLTINGEGGTLDGGAAYNGLIAYAGTVAIDNLTIADARAAGGAGGSDPSRRRRRRGSGRRAVRGRRSGRGVGRGRLLE